MDTSAMLDKLFSSFQGDSPTLQFVGKWGFTVYEKRELIQMYIHLILSALFPIYIGAHASLRRPPSAKEPKKREDGDEIEVDSTVEGLTPSDAILFPILAGITLSGLYFLIKWMQDPALLNKILNYYFSLVGVVGVSKLAADSLNVATTFVFPSVWSSCGNTFFIEPFLSTQIIEVAKPKETNLHRKFTERANPFPGFLSSIKFPKPINDKLWAVRSLLKNHCVLIGYVRRVVDVKFHVRVNDIFGFLIGIAAIFAYNTTGKAWWLTNLIGFGFCYGTLQLMSPTTFWTGSLVLGGLFIYDIVMVFYTPMMVEVATTLDVPIKLVFPGPGRGSMLGLGDVVLPGIMIALALRFDLYLHYLHLAGQSQESGDSITKPPYVDAAGKWGERFWTRGKNDGGPTVADGARFKKVYFKASLVGYVIGLTTTLIVLTIFQQGQPALFYLVPAVLGSLWGTALIRGELKLMWGYTEDGSLEGKGNEKDDRKKVVEKGRNGPSKGTAGTDSSTDQILASTNTSDETQEAVKPVTPKKCEHPHVIFFFSLTAPEKGDSKKGARFGKPSLYE